MRCNIFTAGRIAVLCSIATTILASPLTTPDSSLEKRQSCVNVLALGTAKGFALLSKHSITNAGTPLSITGNVGVTPAGTIVGIAAAQVTGTIHLNTATAANAAGVAANICGCAYAKAPATPLAPELGGLTLTPGIYRTAAAANIAASTNLTLNAGGNAKAQFIIQIPAALTTGASVRINLINGAKACNVFWTVGTPSVNAATTIGAQNFFNGNLCNYGAITTGINVVADGSWFGLTAASSISTAGGIYKAVAAVC